MYLCMYVCMYACMTECMYMYVCMYVLAYVCTCILYLCLCVAHTVHNYVYATQVSEFFQAVASMLEFEDKVFHGGTRIAKSLRMFNEPEEASKSDCLIRIWVQNQQ